MSDEIPPTPDAAEVPESEVESEAKGQESETQTVAVRTPDTKTPDIVSTSRAGRSEPPLGEHAMELADDELDEFDELDDLDDAADEPADALGDVLRERLARAVSGLEPAAGTLEYLRYAVPIRRKRRQTALATTAVTVFAVSAAVTLVARGGPPDANIAGTTTGVNVDNPSNSPAPRTVVGGVGGVGGVGHSQRVGATSPYAPTLLYTGIPAGPTATLVEPTAVNPATPPPSMTSGVSASPGAARVCDGSLISSAPFTPGPVSAGISYETVTVTVQTACTMVGPPSLLAVDANGNVPVPQVPVYRADGIAAPLLANVPTSRAVLTLAAGAKFQFQFAWVPTVCAVAANATPTTTGQSLPMGSPSSSPVVPTTPSGGAVTTTIRVPTSTTAVPSPPLPTPAPYTVQYYLYGSTPVTQSGFSASCGASIYTTDIFLDGTYAPPHAAVTVPTATPSL